MKIKALFTSLVLLFALSTNALADAAKSPKAKPHKAQQPAQSPQQKVEYPDLGKYIGKRITVLTTLGTVRSGTLTKYTNTSIDLKVDGGVELILPADTIRSASTPVAAADPLFPTAGKPSAEKK